MRFHHACSVAALLASLGTLPARADVTAAEVWADWQASLAGFGYQVQGNTAQSGAVLTVSDVTMTITAPGDGGTVSLSSDRLILTEQGDGTVAATLPATMPMVAALKGDDGAPVDLRLDTSQTALAMTVSGAPGNLAYAFSATELALTATRLAVDGAEVDLRAARLALTGLNGTTLATTGATTRSTAQNVTVASVTWDLDMINPEDATPLRVAGQMNGVAMTGTSVLPVGIDLQDQAALFAAGFAADLDLTHQGGSSDIQFATEGQLAGLKTRIGSGAMTLRIDPTMMDYRGSATGLGYEMRGGPVPVPLTAEIARAGANLLLPLQKSDDPRDFALGVTLGDVVVSDVIWSMFDPMRQLPRDPATLVLDLTGKARVTADLTDPARGPRDAAPGEIHALTLNDLTLRFAGADLTGTGAVTFDNSDTTTLPGMPRPEGVVDLKLVGGNTLLDRLIAMGLVPADQAMGVRMMMGVFGKMDGPDTLTSRIEMTRDGQIVANGQRIR